MELVANMEFSKSGKFSPKKLFSNSKGTIKRFFRNASVIGRSSSLSETLSYSTQEEEQTPGLSVIQETLCRFQINVSDLSVKCHENILDRKWSWEIVEREKPEPRSLSRSSSRIIEAGYHLFQKVQRRTSFRTTASTIGELGVYAVCEVAEAGFMQMKAFFIDRLSSPMEQKMVPKNVKEAQEWFNSKKWHETCWYAGFLSQQGGDVKFWRRRYFVITGAKMDVFHEYVRLVDKDQNFILGSNSIR